LRMRNVMHEHVKDIKAWLGVAFRIRSEGPAMA